MGWVYHRASGNYCYALDKDTLRISIQTDDTVPSVELVWGDPYTAGIAGADTSAWKGNTTEMTDKKHLRNNAVWWTSDVKPPFKRCRYFFFITGADGEKRIFCEDGFHPMSDMGTFDLMLNAFVFPWMNEGDICTVPAWAGETVWYQIFPSRFCRGNPSAVDANGAPLLSWASPSHPVTNDERYGGDLAGMTGRLDYLADLGITGVYLTPVNMAPSQHKYDTRDYFDIDRDFGTKEDMRRFVDEAHKRGIRVMLDGVFNHVGQLFFAWGDVVANREKSKYKDWFIINDMNFDAHDWYNAAKGKYYAFGFHDGMPKLNTNNPEVREYICTACEEWIKVYGIDAIRLDVANEVSHVLCRQLRTHLKSIKSDFYIVGEIWHNALPWLEGDQFDAVMNYPLSASILRFALSADSARRLECDINRCLTSYSRQVTSVLLNQLDSHDTVRAVTRLGSADTTLQCLTLLFCLPGAACIYYGDEVLLPGGHDPDCRRCMPWKEIDSGEYKETMDAVKALIHLRREVKAMRAYDTQFLHEEGERVVHIVKSVAGTDGNGTERVDAIFNFGNAPAKVTNVHGSRVLLQRGLDGDVLHGRGLVLLKHE